MKWVTNVAVAAFEAIPLPGFQLAGSTISAKFLSSFDCSAVRFVLGEHYGRIPMEYGRGMVEVNGVKAPLCINGNPVLTIAPGKTAATEPVMLPVKAGDRITLWLYNTSGRNPSTVSLYTQSHSPKGDWCGQPFLPEPFSASVGGLQLREPLGSFCRLEGAVADDSPAQAIAAFGDSITAMDLWVSALRQRIQKTHKGTALLNLGISGNRLLRDTCFASAAVQPQLFGRSGLKRLVWDVLEAPGISTVLLALGGNDIAQPGGNPVSTPPVEERCKAEELTEGYRSVLRVCHEKGIRVVGCTITPFGGYMTACPETFSLRREVNAWIRESGEFDAVVDFSKVIADPQNEDYMLPDYDSGDHLHPSPVGGKVMADSVDLGTLFSDLTVK